MILYTHLHTHSHYSLLNALPKIPELVKAAKEDGQSALALTDDGNMYAAVAFYKECKANDIKPIMGVDFFVAARTRHDKVSGIDSRRTRLVLLAKNNTGYRNLMKLTSRSNIEGFYYKPRIDRELIKEYSEGLICIIPQFSGETSSHLRLNNFPQAAEALNFFKETYGEDLYMEVLHHPESPEQTDLKEKVISFAKKNNVPIVATSDSYYQDPDDKPARDILVDVGNIKAGGGRRDELDFSLHDVVEMNNFFKDHPEALKNTREIAGKCNVTIELGKWTFPNFDLPKGQAAVDILRDKAYAGFEPKGIELTDEYRERVEYELKVIKDKGYDIYFLVVGDLMRYAKENEILTNTRGSAAGCLVSYLVGITNLDPVEYKLPFERFLNPERPSPPDVDMDIADDKRDELIAYARRKYGETQVAQIGTFGTMAARGAVKDAARAMGYPYAKGDLISKLIPFGAQGFPMTIDRAHEESEDLAKLYKSDKETREIVEMAKKLEGSARHISVHAAGVVIAPTFHNGEPVTITDFTPIQPDPKGHGKLITQFDMHAVEDVGLLKYDFLGLKNLTVMYEAIRRIRKTRDIEINLDTLELTDQKTYEMLSAGDTYGVFQMSSDGMTKWIKELQPTTVHDLNAMVALYRPGPMEFIPEYIRRKKNPKLVTYPDPRTKPYLEGSLGLLIYQDDIMQLAVDMAGYSWLEADLFRKAMGKKIPKLMAEQETKFKTGCKASGMPNKVVNELWDNIVTFAAYGFNKGHAAAYGNVSYKTAYLKANFTPEYMAALMSADSGDNESIAREVTECKKMGIPVLPPDVNKSFENFGVNLKTEENKQKKDEVRFGLRTIKNFGEAISEQVVEDRKEHGEFKNLEDFITRMAKHDLNKKSLEALSLSGALDSLEDRNTILGNLEELLEFAKEQRSHNPGQDSLFASLNAGNDVSHLNLKDATGKVVSFKTGMAEELSYVLPLSDKDKLFWEKELLGLYVSGHPLAKYAKVIQQPGRNIRGALAKGWEKSATFAGILSEIRVINTKKGDKMAFSRLSDTTGTIDATFFPKIYKQFASEMSEDKVFQVKGKLQKRDGDLGFLVDDIKELV